jgi:hypothetical protein
LNQYRLLDSVTSDFHFDTALPPNMLQNNPAAPFADEGFIDGEAMHLATSTFQMMNADELTLSGMGSVRDTEGESVFFYR